MTNNCDRKFISFLCDFNKPTNLNVFKRPKLDLKEMNRENLFDLVWLLFRFSFQSVRVPNNVTTHYFLRLVTHILKYAMC